MPIFNAHRLAEIANRIVQAAGASIEEASVVSGELVEANLVGHDSHGVMRLMQYVNSIEAGHIKPGGIFEVLKNKPAFVLVDGHFNFGQVIVTRALRLGLEKARASGTGTVMIRNCNHVGRLGSYTEKAAHQGMLAMMTVNAPGPGGVAPFGGIDRRLGTNPLSIAAPWEDAAIVLDMTTSASAEGKLRVAHQKGESIPEGWLIDAEGNPTTDPGAFYTEPGGALLPLGGPLAHKGYGLSVMIDVLAGILSGSGVCRTDLPRGANGVWMHFIDIKQFLSRDRYETLIAQYVEHLKSSRLRPGASEILLPGEIERRRADERSVSGVNIPEETWRQIEELAQRLNVSLH